MRDDLAQLEADIEQRLRAQVVTGVYTSGTVGATFTVVHALGTKPSIAVALPYSQAQVWAEESDRRLWNGQRVVLRSNVALVPLDVLVVE